MLSQGKNQLKWQLTTIKLNELTGAVHTLESNDYKIIFKKMPQPMIELYQLMNAVQIKLT
jgi:hypothetical protein